MATISKTDTQTLLALQSLASNAVVISAAFDVSTKLAGLVGIHFGRRSNTALTEGVFLRIEASMKATGDGFWFPVASFQSQIAAVTSQAVNGTCNAGQNVVAMTATAGMNADPLSAQGHIVYIDNTTIANAEFQRVKVVTTNTSITLEDNLTNAQTGATVYPGAEMFVAAIDLTAIKRIRFVANADNTGVAVAVEAWIVTGDSIG